MTGGPSRKSPGVTDTLMKFAFLYYFLIFLESFIIPIQSPCFNFSYNDRYLNNFLTYNNNYNYNKLAIAMFLDLIVFFFSKFQIRGMRNRRQSIKNSKFRCWS